MEKTPVKERYLQVPLFYKTDVKIFVKFWPVDYSASFLCSQNYEI